MFIGTEGLFSNQKRSPVKLARFIKAPRLLVSHREVVDDCRRFDMSGPKPATASESACW